MKHLVNILNTVVAFCCILIVLLCFWFLYMVFAKNVGGAEAAGYIVSEVSRWWDVFCGWCISLFS